MEKKVKGKRSRGRPRDRWEYQVRIETRKRGVNCTDVEEQEIRMERGRWRLLSRTLSSNRGHEDR